MLCLPDVPGLRFSDLRAFGSSFMVCKHCWTGQSVQNEYIRHHRKTSTENRQEAAADKPETTDSRQQQVKQADGRRQTNRCCTHTEKGTRMQQTLKDRKVQQSGAESWTVSRCRGETDIRPTANIPHSRVQTWIGRQHLATQTAANLSSCLFRLSGI